MHFGVQGGNMGSKMDTRGGVFEHEHIFKLCGKMQTYLDLAGAIGLEFPPLVFVLWASWEALAARLFPRTIQKDTSTGNFNDFQIFLDFGVPRGLPLG